MKKFILLIAVIVIMGIPADSFAAILYSNDFESDLAGWTGQGGWPHHGVILADPLNPSNKVLGFTDWNSMGDIYTIASFYSPSQTYTLSFDYMGDPSMGGIPGDLGGYIGYSYAFPGYHVWLAGTGSGWGGPDLLPDTGNWVHMTINFSDPAAFHLMLEDFKDVGGIDNGGVRGDVYFDNIILQTPDSPVVPEPATFFLITLGGLSLGFLKRRP